jgi:hypothetical protein
MDQVERKNTIECIFDALSPKISAYRIHEWIHSDLKLTKDQVRMIQIDWPKRRVYIKMVSEGNIQTVLRNTGGHQQYVHANGQISMVTIERVGMGEGRVRIAYLPPEVQNTVVRAEMEHYGVVRNVQEETWARQYKYAVSNGVRLVDMKLKTHVPSHLYIAGYRVLISYDGQPTTCFNCKEEGHQ